MDFAEPDGSVWIRHRTGLALIHPDGSRTDLELPAGYEEFCLGAAGEGRIGLDLDRIGRPRHGGPMCPTGRGPKGGSTTVTATLTGSTSPSMEQGLLLLYDDSKRDAETLKVVR